jgi:hypothetical protein
MRYAPPIKRADNSQVESKSSKNTASVPSGYMPNLEWNWKHPSIQDTFYLKIEAPADADDARIKMNCHQHAVKDFDLQLEMNNLELDMIKDGEEVLPYNISKFEELEQKKLKLLVGKRFHQNAANAYWFHLAKCGK